MNAVERELRLYVAENGKVPYSLWLHSLKDSRARAMIRVRLNRIRLGNFGDCKPVGDGVKELRIDYGPGYRVYFGQVDQRIVLLLCGGINRPRAGILKKPAHTGRITGEEKMATSKSYAKALIRELKDPREAAEYLSMALEDGNMEVFLLALKDVAEALGGGFSKLSRKTRLNRENLYRMLSEKGNPELRSMGALLGALGLKLSVDVKKAS